MGFIYSIDDIEFEPNNEDCFVMHHEAGICAEYCPCTDECECYKEASK